MVIEPGNGLNTHTATSSKARQASAPVREKNASPESPASAEGDNVSLSDAGQNLAKLEARLSEMPDVDSAKVAEVKAALTSGRLQVDADAIAGKMLDQDQSF